MALSKEKSAEDSAALTRILDRQRLTSAQKQVAQQRLAAVAQIAHANDILLASQGRGFTRLLLRLMRQSLTDKRDNHIIAAELMTKLEQYQQRQTKTIVDIFSKQSAGFDSLPLHEASANSLMTEKQIESLLPLDTVDFKVLSPINTGLALERDSIVEALAAAMQEKRVKAIIIPVSKGNHWRLIAIDKATKAGNKHQISVFDSMGACSAKSLFGDVKRLLSDADLPPANFEVEPLTAKIPQRDGYSCGDYVVAAAHSMAQQYQVGGVNRGLINTLASKGNVGGALRFATTNMARQQAGLPLLEKRAFARQVKRGTKRKRGETPTLPSNFQNSLDKLFFKPSELTQRPGDRLVTKRFSDFKQNSLNKDSAKSAEAQFQEDLDARLAQALAAGQTEGMSVADEQRQVKETLANLLTQEPSPVLRL